MANKILLTSFDTWLPHQRSNASDDLLEQIAQSNYLSPSLTLLRKLPVDVEKASCAAIAKLNELHPDVIVCCGMAEQRTQLTVESNATCGNIMLATRVDLKRLVAGSDRIEISHDAEKFVCEGLYYSMLKYLQERQIHIPCVFVHVPILTEENSAEVVADFRLILHEFMSRQPCPIPYDLYD